MDLEQYMERRENARTYIEKTFNGTREEYFNALEQSATLYVTNIGMEMREEQLWALFKLCGGVRRVIRGVNGSRLTPCDFAFIEYYEPEHARSALMLFRDMEFNGRRLKLDKDIGFSEGRQFGRGAYGGRLKDERVEKRRQHNDL